MDVVRYGYSILRPASELMKKKTTNPTHVSQTHCSGKGGKEGVGSRHLLSEGRLCCVLSSHE